MSLLFRVLYAVHARGTHHKLALDALPLLSGEDAEGWRRFLLKNAEPFMTGAKAPDDQFKDFKNHVLHPRDGFWGGAPKAAREWYDKLVAALRSESWQDAAFAAGVLSHYVTDPVHPFHTAQSEAENAIHRAFEWSTAKSYDAVKAAARAAPAAASLPDGPGWLEEALRDAAAQSNRHYEKLIAHYDINRGVVDPPAGLDIVAQRIVGDLVHRASGLFAAILQRATTEAGVRPPEVTLTLDTVLATLAIPLKKLLNKLADRADRLQVERMYDELRATGTVEANLPEDDRMVRNLHRAEVLEIAAKPSNQPSVPDTRAVTASSSGPGKQSLVTRIDETRTLSSLSITKPPQSVAAAIPDTLSKPVPAGPGRLTGLASLEGQANEPQGTQPAAPVIPMPVQASASKPQARPRLSPADPVVDAPSIGPRTATRLERVGIITVGDLLEAAPSPTARALDTRHITEATIREWQAQARLVCAVPGLSGTAAQLLVGAGFSDISAVAQAGNEELCAAVLRYATSPDGQRLLRNGEPPDVEKIKAWAEAARLAAAA